MERRLLGPPEQRGQKRSKANWVKNQLISPGKSGILGKNKLGEKGESQGCFYTEVIAAEEPVWEPGGGVTG